MVKLNTTLKCIDKELKEYLRNNLKSGDSTRIQLTDGENEVGIVELSLEDFSFGGGNLYLELRNIEIHSRFRKKGYSVNVIRQLKDLGYSIFGTIVEEECNNLIPYWECMGAEFLNDTDFIIPVYQ